MVITLGIFYLLMSPPMNDIGLMAGFLSITALISGVAGYSAYRLGWIERSPTIRWSLLGGYALASGLTFLNVWVTASLMFTDPHDLLLATVLLIFASGMAMTLGYILSGGLTNRIQVLDRAAQAIAAGNLDVRIVVNGRDEMATLATTFNQMAAQLEAAAQKQAELDTLKKDLIAWVSHDLHTPLASIRAIVEALVDGVVEDKETEQRYLASVQREIRSLSQLIDDLFQMAQLDTGDMRLDRDNSSLSDLVSDTLESFTELAARKDVTLRGHVAPDLDPVFMDTNRIGRVLNNLVGNALRHTQAGGTVEVIATRTPSGPIVEVIDNGEGIRPADLPYVFDRFYRGEKSRSRTTGGAGLGLAIAKGIVEAHEGRIGVESQPGKTRFFFTLPG
jgi:signal transduction histidine kinase